MKSDLNVVGFAVLAIPMVAVCWAIAVFFMRWFRLRGRPRTDQEQVLLGAVSQSLRERGELAVSLGQLRTVHERLLDAMPFGVLWANQLGRIAALNLEGRRLLGVKPGVVGMLASFVLEPFPWLKAGLEQIPGASVCVDGGGRRWRVRRIETPDMVGTLLQFEDITEAEAAERRALLRDRFAELGEMTAGVAHQLKNGLAVLKGQGQLLARQGHGDFAQDLLQETDDMERLVQRFLQWAKPLDPQLAEVDLAQVAGQALAEVARRPEAQGKVLMLEGSGVTQADAQLLLQALVNLLENACQATPAGGRITVSLTDRGVDIQDEGPGFGEDTLVRMMRPFESGRPDGTGLGLPLALKWLSVQGAELMFEPLEVGTRAKVRW